MDIKLRIVRGRTGPADKRFEYSTLIDYIIKDEGGKTLTMGITPPVYFFLKQVLNEELDDLERVIFHNIRRENRKILKDLFIDNNLLNISLKGVLVGAVDRIVIDGIKSVGKLNYNFSASIYLNNGQRIPNIIPSDAVVIALLANKSIYITDSLLDEKEKIDKEIEEKMTSKKEPKPESEDEQKEGKVPKSLYT